MKFHRINFATGEIKDIEVPLADLLSDTDESGDRANTIDYVDTGNLILVAYREKAARGLDAPARLKFLQEAGATVLACTVNPETIEHAELSPEQVKHLKTLLPKGEK